MSEDSESPWQLKKLMKEVDEIKKLEALENYLLWQTTIDNISNKIELTVFEDGKEISTANEFMKLKKIWVKLRDTNCTNLVDFCKDTILYWYKILKEKFEVEFQSLFKAIQWPKINLKISSGSENYVKFDSFFESLLTIQLPNDVLAEVDPIMASYKLSLPIRIMLDPLRKRFMFHFMTKKKTNRYDKPEWYLTQILTWINDHIIFIESHIQPLLSKIEPTHLNAKDQFIMGLVQLANDKLFMDMTEVLCNDQLLSHTIDEVLIFAAEINKLDVSLKLPNVLDVLTSNDCFPQWKRLEHQCALTKMDALLTDSKAWEFRYKDGDLDEMKVSECAEAFMTLLKTLTDRYQIISKKPILQLEFLELQIDLLDDFRLRLYQLITSGANDSLDSNVYPIINGINYVITILSDWNCQPKFVYLHHVKECHQISQLTLAKHETELSDEPGYFVDDNGMPTEETVFENIIKLYKHMLNDLLTTLWKRIFRDIKSKCLLYFNEKWFYLPIVETLEPSSSIFPILEIIKTYFHKLEEALAKELFAKTWQQIACELNKYIYEEFILDNSFSEGGALQFQYDMNRCLLPVFGGYTSTPESHFIKIKESCYLLSLNHGMISLKKDLLRSYKNKSLIGCPALEDIHVYNFSIEEAEKILSLRIDIQ